MNHHLFRVTSVTDAVCYVECEFFSDAIAIAEKWFQETCVLRPDCVHGIEMVSRDPVLRAPEKAPKP